MGLYYTFYAIIFLYSFTLVRTAHNKKSHEFDLLIFTQHWPSTVCDEWKKNNPSHTCHLPNNIDMWSIHGVWPTKLHTIGPAFCNNSWRFDPEMVRPIEPQLLQLWTDIEDGTHAYGLWTHEWSKHGTCAAALQPLNSELKYFSQGINWLNKYQMYDILDSAGIVPSNEKVYNIKDIHKSIVDKLGVNPCIECRSENGKNYLFELRICFDKSLGLLNCDGVVGTTTFEKYDDIITNCHPSVPVLYPKTPNSINTQNTSSTWYIELYKLIQWLQWFTL